MTKAEKDEPFYTSISDIPNKEEWINIAKDAAENPDDFKKWEKLVKFTEFLPSINLKSKFKIDYDSNKNEKLLVLLVYENLLINFPLLENYWINYANWFYTFNNLTKSILIYEKALNLLPNSLIIWNSFIDLNLKINSNIDNMIKIFEKARKLIGLHYYSFSFYDKYLNFLSNNKLTKQYILLLRYLIEIPQYDYLKYFKKFLSNLESCDLDNLKYLISTSDLKNNYNLIWDDFLNNEKLINFKLELKKKFLDLFITTQYYSWKFYFFESSFSNQFYLPNKNLNRLQLQKWSKYLNYLENLNLKIAIKDKEISRFNFNKLLIESVYNRCLIITGSYSYFYLKFSNYYLNYNELDNAKLVLIKGLYLNPIKNLTIRIRLIDLSILTLNFDNAKFLVLEGLSLLPNNYQLFSKLLEIEHFILSSNVEKLIIDKLNYIINLNNKDLEYQFDYLFIEMLNYHCINLTKMNQIFSKFKFKKSYYYLKAKKMFIKYYDINNKLNEDDQSFKNLEKSNWVCEYF